jgi:alkylation response protein AidB-like acyl-CoA dehydrogenase
MLNAAPSEDQRAVAELAEDVAMSLLEPEASSTETAKAVPEHVWTRLWGTELAGPYLDVDGRAQVMPAAMQLTAIEKLAYGDGGIALAFGWAGAAAMLFRLHGTAEQVELAAELIGPSARTSIALYEGYGRGPDEFATTITRGSDGSARVRGRKVAVPLAGSAKRLAVVGVDSVTNAPVVVATSANADGIIIQPAGDGIALAAAKIATVSFDVTVPAEDVVGGATIDSASLTNSIHRIRLLSAAAAIGTGQRAVDYASQYATQRVAFGRPIASFQGVSFPLAEAHTRLHQARLEIAALATRIDTDDPVLNHEVGEAISYATEAASQAARTSVQTLGGHGFTLDYPVERWYRCTAALSALDFDPAYSPFRPAL